MLVEGVCCIEIVLVLFLPSLETCKDSSIGARVLSLCCCPLASCQVREFILLFSSTNARAKSTRKAHRSGRGERAAKQGCQSMHARTRAVGLLYFCVAFPLSF